MLSSSILQLVEYCSFAFPPASFKGIFNLINAIDGFILHLQLLLSFTSATDIRVSLPITLSTSI